MPSTKWSALFGSVLAVLLPTQPPHPPIDSVPDAPEPTWSELISRMPPAGRPPGGSRGSGDDIYPIAPGLGRAEWHERLLFLWQGSIRQIELTAAESEEPIWSQTVDAAARSCRYSGPRLPSGRSYAWILYNRAKAPVARVVFRTLSQSQRDSLAAELAALDAQRPHASAEERALHRACCFAAYQLWSDVLYEAFAVERPSPELATLRQQWVQPT